MPGSRITVHGSHMRGENEMKFTKLLLAAFTAFTLVGCSKTEKVDITPYIDIAVEGMNGEGVATVVFDSENFSNAVAAVSDVKTDADRESVKQAAITAVELNLDKQETLSNGDTVKVSATLNNDLLKPYKVELTATDKEFEVADLRDIIVVDPFDPTIFNVSDDVRGIHIKVAGADPLVTVEITNDCSNDMYQKNITYSFDPKIASDYFDGEHKAGDEITIYAIPNLYSLPEEEYAFESLSTTFTISNAPRYVQSLDDLSEEQLVLLQNLAGEKTDAVVNKERYQISDYEAGWSPKIVRYENMTPFRVYLVKLKEGHASSTEFSTLGILYKLNNVHAKINMLSEFDFETIYVFSYIESPVLSAGNDIYEFRGGNSFTVGTLTEIDSNSVNVTNGYIDIENIEAVMKNGYKYPDLTYIELDSTIEN